MAADNRAHFRANDLDWVKAFFCHVFHDDHVVKGEGMEGTQSDWAASIANAGASAAIERTRMLSLRIMEFSLVVVGG